eukprot:Phypoly_transcript_05783.p1 GENE.Phypoly_transcript_05783~~Phypoly_transcript_05783.p1  ORF type:complete len:583 (+),score=42.49 Phypoly_transcript_05783:136-1884(+)
MQESYHAQSTSAPSLLSPAMKDPLLLRSPPSSKRKRILNGSLLPNFVIPTPYSRKNKILVSFSLLACIVLVATICGVLALLLNSHIHFGGMLLYKYFFTITGVVASYMLLMVVITLIMRAISRFSKRFRYYIAPFAVPLYTCVWATLCFEFLPIIVPEINSLSQPTKVLKECIRIAASCSIVSAAGIILLIVMERIVYGEQAERLWNVLWSERCVAVLALENHSSEIEAINQSARPDNVLSLANVIRDENHSLVCWLGLPQWDSKDDHALVTCAANIANMIMRRRDVNGKGCLYFGDLATIPDLRGADARNLFRLFDTNAQGYATQDDIKNAIEVILLEKKYVVDMCTSRSLIIGIFHQLIRAIVATIILVIILVILLDVAVYTLLVGLGTAFLGLGFALSTTIQGLLESLQMIFFVRPFEIGDIVKINDGPPLYVEKVSIISTFFYTLDGYGIYYPNAQLARSTISNWKRSRDVTFDIPLYLSMEMNAEHLNILRQKIQAYLDSNSQLSPKFTMLVSEFQKMCVTVTVKVTLKTIWQDRAVWVRFAADLRLFAIEKVVELGIHYQFVDIVKNVPWEPHNMI